ncbi:MAG: 50S ribosomal protein L25 [Chloroflexi bacterium]|nr:50S ribosomal protein L25 [Chloroflexota bacterium]
MLIVNSREAFNLMEEILLTAQPRTVKGKQVSQLRRADWIPAVLYGRHLEKTVSIQIEEKLLRQVIVKAGHNRLIKLTVENDGGERLVLTREIQRNSISGKFVHVDFQEVSMTEKIHTQIPIVLAGTSPVVTRGEGVLIHGIDSLDVRVLPADLVPNFLVDVSVLVELHKSLLVGDLQLGEQFEIMTARTEMIAKVVPVKEEVIETVAPVATTEVEVIKKGKIEEEGAEGEAPAAGGEAKKPGDAKKPAESKKEEKK